jgi:sulfonate transport system substrate-binding protein
MRFWGERTSATDSSSGNDVALRHAPYAIDRRSLILQAGMLGLYACAPAGRASGTALRVATYRGGIDGEFAAAGVTPKPGTVESAVFSGGNFITEAIEAQAIDLGSMSEIPPVFAAGRKSLIKLVAVQRADVNFQMVLVPGQSDIRHTMQLKGKRIGYIRATTSHYLLLRVLAEDGLTFADIVPIALSPADGLAAFRRGSLDVWVTYDLGGYLARQEGARLLTTGLGRMSGNYTWAALEPSLADPHRRAGIVDYLSRVRTTHQWIEHNPEKWAGIQAAGTGVDPAMFLQQFRERSQPTRLEPVSEDAIKTNQQVADTFAAAGILPARVDVRPMWSHALDADLKA